MAFTPTREVCSVCVYICKNNVFQWYVVAISVLLRAPSWKVATLANVLKAK